MFQISGNYNFKLLNGFFSYSLQKSVIISSHLNMLKENLIEYEFYEAISATLKIIDHHVYSDFY